MYAKLIILAVLVSSFVFTCYGQGKNQFKHVNVDEILKNERLVKSYIACFMDEGPCVAEAAAIKKLAPEALKNRCEKCTDDEKLKIRKAMKYAYEKRKDVFTKLIQKYQVTEYQDQIIQWMNDQE